MRKLFAMVATVAVVLSMFAGIAFAAGTPASLTFATGTQKGWVKAATAGQTINGVAKDAAGVVVDTANALELWEVTSAGAKVGSVIDTQNTSAVDGTFTLTAGNIATGKYLAVFFGATKIADIPVYEPKIVITSATSFISSGNDVGSYLLQGEVRSGSNLLTGFNGTVKVVSGTNPAVDLLTNISVVDGRFQYLVPSNIRFQRFSVVDTGVHDATNNFLAADPAIFDASYSVTLSSDLQFSYTNSPLFAITGTLTDSTGKVVKGTDATLWQSGVSKIGLYYTSAKRPTTKIAETSTLTAAGQFSLTVDTWPAGAGDIGLFISWDGDFNDAANTDDAVLLKTGKVAAATDATLTATPNTGITHSVTATNVKLSLKGVPQNGFDIDWKLYYGSETSPTASGSVAGANTGASWNTATGAHEWTYNSNFSAKKAGSYTMKVTAKTNPGNVVTYEASATITVNDANAGYMVLDKTGYLTKLDAVGQTKTLDFGNPASVVALKIKADGTLDGVATFKYVVYVNGVKKVDTIATPATTTVELKGTKLGTIPVRVQVYEVVGPNNVKVIDKTYTVEVPGWNVEYDVTAMTVNETRDITFNITDKDGNPVNNAQILIGGVVAVTAANTNISNGVYVAKNIKSSTPVVKNIEVQTLAGTLKAQFVNGLNITGVKAYDVTSSFETLLHGKTDKVRFTVTEGENVIIPTRVQIQQGTTTTTLTATSVDTNSDGKLDAIDVSITPATTKDATVRVMNSDGTKIGEVVMKVVSPTLVSDAEFLTNNIKSLATFKVVDPRTGNALSNTLTYSEKNLTVATKLFAEDKKTELASTGTILGAAEHKIAFLAAASSADFTAAADANEKVELTLKIELNNKVDVKGVFEVKKAQLVSNPDKITVGSSANLVITYQDANAKPIVDKEVFVGADDKGISLGKTDDKGQVNYAVTQSATVAFAAKTDDTTTYTKLTVPAVVDTAAPVVTAPETSEKATATINIKDNVRVIRLMVDGVELNIIPRAELNHVVNLKVGANKFEIVAVDNNFNLAEETVTITYTPAAAADDKVVLKGAAVERQGNFLFVQIRKFEELGAKLTWNGTTKTATFVAGGKTVEVVVGSTTAKVNGVAATMPAAPKLVNGRVLVPTRFISEALGWKVDWAAGDIVTITLP